jgi:phage protein U
MVLLLTIQIRRQPESRPVRRNQGTDYVEIILAGHAPLFPITAGNRQRLLALTCLAAYRQPQVA